MMRCVELLNQQWPDAARPWQDKALADWREAEQCLDRALKIRPTSQIAKAQLRGVQRQISDLVVRGRYVPLKMKAQ